MKNDENIIAPESNLVIQFPGSLRDWFAGQALNGLAANQDMLLSNLELMRECGRIGIDRLQANKAYRLADAMLAERKKKT